MTKEIQAIECLHCHKLTKKDSYHLHIEELKGARKNTRFPAIYLQDETFCNVACFTEYLNEKE